jgi:hypothetical protein
MAEKKRVFRMFASGKTPEQVVAELGLSPGGDDLMTLSRVETLYGKYVTLPIGEKLKLTLMTECVSNRVHRLMDDICDLNHVDSRLSGTNEKGLVSLLDIKRKIKDRMAKEFATEPPDSNDSPNSDDEDEIDEEIERYYEKIFGSGPAQTDVQ